MASCCPDGSAPAAAESEGEKLGEMLRVEGTDGDMDCYYVRPAVSSKFGILLFYDIYGISGGRAKEMCDTLASHGFHVAMPDVYFGSSLEAHGGFGEPAAMEWLKSKSEPAKLLRQSEATVAKLKERGAEVVAGVGFCWGAYPLAKCSAASVVGASVSFHPSLKIGNMFFGEQEADLAAAVKGPQCYMPAGNDPPMYTDGTIEKAVTDKAGQPCVVKSFPDMKHGFSLRGDLSDPAVTRDVNAAVEAAVAFLKEHM